MSKARDLASANPAPSTVSATELGYLDGVTSAIQTQIDSKQAANANVSTTELGYLDGVTSAIQTQLDGKVAASIVDAKGDIIAATAADTVTRLAVGSNNQVLTADSSTATGLKWATPAAGGMTLISTTTLTGASVTLSSIPGTYNNLQLIIQNYQPASDRYFKLRMNSDSTANRHVGGTGAFDSTSFYVASNQDSTTSQSLIIINIHNYTNTTTWKFMRAFGVNNNDTTPTNANIENSYGAYNQTGAITSLQLFPDSGNFTSGTALLYGVK